MNAWQLVKDGKYQEALALFSSEVVKKPSTMVFNNRGTVYLHLGDYDAALADFRSAEAVCSRDLKIECDGALCGVALWMAGRPTDAVQIWSQGVLASLEGRVRYGDAAGGVTVGNLLTFGAAHLGNQEAAALAKRLLRKRLRTKQSMAWPGPTSRFLLGDITEADMMAAVSSVPILQEREMCQARFYVGTRALLAGQRAVYAAAMQEAFEYGSVAKLGAEYNLARHEHGTRGDR